MEEKVNVGGLNTTFQRIPVNYANSFNLEEEIIWMPSKSLWFRRNITKYHIDNTNQSLTERKIESEEKRENQGNNQGNCSFDVTSI